MINTQNKQRTVIAVLVILATLCLFFLWMGTRSTNVPPSPKTTAIVGGNDTQSYAGTISSSTAGLNTYTNNKYALQFDYPATWKVGDNALGYGTFQLLNYDSTYSSGSGFASGTNKIEAGISSENTYGTSSDYPEKSRVTKKITVSGQPATLVDIELGGQNIRNYSIELPASSGKFFSISIYGDQKNFTVLDNLVRSIRWIPAEAKP